MKIFCSAAFLPIVNIAPTMQEKAPLITENHLCSEVKWFVSSEKYLPKQSGLYHTLTLQNRRAGFACVCIQRCRDRPSQPVKEPYFIATIASGGGISQLLKSRIETQPFHLSEQRKLTTCEGTGASWGVIGQVISNVTVSSVDSEMLISARGG